MFLCFARMFDNFAKLSGARASLACCGFIRIAHRNEDVRFVMRKGSV